MILKPQDLLASIWIALRGQSMDWSYARLAEAIGISPSQALEAVRRARKAQLLGLALEGGPWRAITTNLIEFMLHGARYAFPPDRGGITRGVPTSFGAPVFGGRIRGELPPIWAHPLGKVRGEAFSPLYKTVPEIALRDPIMYEAMALLDAIRGGSARERAQASAQLPRLAWQGKR